jgi:hypothetical protein
MSTAPLGNPYVNPATGHTYPHVRPRGDFDSDGMMTDPEASQQQAPATKPPLSTNMTRKQERRRREAKELKEKWAKEAQANLMEIGGKKRSLKKRKRKSKKRKSKKRRSKKRR